MRLCNVTIHAEAEASDNNGVSTLRIAVNTGTVCPLIVNTVMSLRFTGYSVTSVIFVLLYLIFRCFSDALLIMATLPFALVGGFWLMYLPGYNMSIASAVGFIALGGVASEIGVVMLVSISTRR
jgi:multidrug efflux pump subunit AcrB